MTLGQRLKAIREEKKVSQQALANQLEINQTTVSDWERDCSVPRADQALALARKLGVDPVWLIEGDAPTAQPAAPQTPEAA